MEAVLTKEDIAEQIKSLPQKFKLDDLVEKLILIEKINLAKLQISNGQFVNDEELDNITDKW